MAGPVRTIVHCNGTKRQNQPDERQILASITGTENDSYQLDGDNPEASGRNGSTP